MATDPTITPDRPTPPDRPERLELRAMLLLALLVLLLAGSGLYLLYARGAFETTQRLVLVADDSEGVIVGMDLTFAGFPIGRVRRIELAEDGSTRILVDVPVKDARWLRQSSVFTLTRGLLGNTNLRAFSGVLSDPPLPDGATRKVLAGDATTEVPRLVASMRDLVDNLTRLTSSGSALAGTLDNVQAATAKLNAPGGALGLLMGEPKDAAKVVQALDRTNRLLARMDALVGRTDGLLGRADEQVFGSQGVMPEVRATVQQLQALLGDTRESLKKMDALLVEAQGAAKNVRGATDDLGRLRGDVEASLRKVDSLLNEVNRKWPFKRETELKLP